MTMRTVSGSVSAIRRTAAGWKMYSGLASPRRTFSPERERGNIALYQSMPLSKFSSKKCTSFVSAPLTSGCRSISW